MRYQTPSPDESVRGWCLPRNPSRKGLKVARYQQQDKIGEPRVLVVGETLTDILHQHDGTIEERPGGSCANVALTLGRLGRRPQLLTSLGEDQRGLDATAWLQASGVTVHAQRTARTSTATANLDADGAADYEFDIDWSLAVEEVCAIDMLHVGSIAATLQPGADAVTVLVDNCRDKALITFDPNIRPSLVENPDETRQRVLSLVNKVDVVKASDEDIAWLYPGEDMELVAHRWLASGPELVVITSGANGALAMSRSATIRVPAVPTIVVDTVGAGDTFMGTLIDALIAKGAFGSRVSQAISSMGSTEISELIADCARSAAITVSRPGADPPTRAELFEETYRS
nr:carbohydrate kinase [Arthrobacter stackebrandtii]